MTWCMHPLCISPIPEDFISSTCRQHLQLMREASTDGEAGCEDEFVVVENISDAEGASCGNG